MSDLSDPLHPWFPQQSAKVVLGGVDGFDNDEAEGEGDD